MRKYYYYSTITSKYYKNIFSAVSDILLDPSRIMTSITGCRGENWSNFTDPHWCDSHEDIVCDTLGLYRTRTKSRIELRIQRSLYKMLTKGA